MTLAEIERVYPDLLTEGEERKLRNFLERAKADILQQSKSSEYIKLICVSEVCEANHLSTEGIWPIWRKMYGFGWETALRTLVLTAGTPCMMEVLDRFGLIKQDEENKMETVTHQLPMGFGQNAPMLSDVQMKAMGLLRLALTRPSEHGCFHIAFICYLPEDVSAYLQTLEGLDWYWVYPREALRAGKSCINEILKAHGCGIDLEIQKEQTVAPDLNALVPQITDWARDKGIFDKATPETQLIKAMEEMGELAKFLLKDNQHEVMDAIGDVAVCLTNLAHMRGTTLNDCVQQAYDVISKRKGKMVNGAFVKKS